MSPMWAMLYQPRKYGICNSKYCTKCFDEMHILAIQTDSSLKEEDKEYLLNKLDGE